MGNHGEASEAAAEGARGKVVGGCALRAPTSEIASPPPYLPGPGCSHHSAWVAVEREQTPAPLETSGFQPVRCRRGPSESHPPPVMV